MPLKREVRWDESRARKVYSHPLPWPGSEWKTVPRPSQTTRRTRHRRRMLRIRLEDGTILKVACMVLIGAVTKGGGAKARVRVGSRGVQVRAASLRGSSLWHRVLLRVEQLLAEEPDINMLKYDLWTRRRLGLAPRRQGISLEEDWD
jgi:hypothetical protein